MGDVRELFKSGPKSEILEVLEDTVRRAQRGELRAVALVLVDKEGRIFTRARSVDNRHELVAGCAYLTHDLAVNDG